MKYSYDRTASFQDRVKGSFEAVVWISDFSSVGKKSTQ